MTYFEQQTSAERSARRAQPWLTLVVFSIIALAAMLLAMLSAKVIDDQAAKLLDERVDDAESILISNLSRAESSMDSLARSVADKPDPQAIVSQTAFPLIGPDRYSYVAVVRITNGVPVVIAAVGDGPVLGSVLNEQSASTVSDAMQSPGALSTTPVLTIGNDRRLGGALQSVALPSGEVVYLEVQINQLDPNSITSPTAFRGGVRMDVYVGDRIDSANLIVSTSDEPFSANDDVVTRHVHFGNEQLLLAAKASGGLIGALASVLPTIIFVSGLLTALMAAIIVNVLQNRRKYALDLVDQRTQQLNISLDQLHERARLDAVARRASREISNTPDVEGAMAALYAAAHEVFPVDQITLAVPTTSGLTAAAVVGSHASDLRDGASLPFIDLVEEHNHNAELAAKLGMKSVITFPLIAAGETKAVVMLGSEEPNAYGEDNLSIVEAISRETSGVINQLLLLQTERNTARRLKELDELKNEFVGVVAHDLRSPMTVIAGYADMLRHYGNALSDEQRDEYLERISVSVKHLSTLVTDVLEVAHIESGELKVRIEPFDLVSMIETTAHELARATSRECHIRTDGDIPMANGDEQRQWQAFSNLLNNAFKFSSEDTAVEVGVTRKGDLIEVSVEDHGMGMLEEDLPRVFQKFSRVTQPGGGRIGGTGLGLYITKSLVEAQGGQISVKSTAGVGSTFRYTVPIASNPSTFGHEVLSNNI